MDIELVKQLETANDGQTIHLFFDEMVGVYLAFGLSAYYTTMVVTPYVSFSEALQMPVALLRKGHINSLRQKVGTAGYERWMEQELVKTKL